MTKSIKKSSGSMMKTPTPKNASAKRRKSIAPLLHQADSIAFTRAKIAIRRTVDGKNKTTYVAQSKANIDAAKREIARRGGKMHVELT